MNKKVYERSNDYRQQFFKANKPLFGKNIYQCAYCGKLKRKKNITVDHVIPVNKVNETGYRRGKRETVEAFCKLLNDNGQNATIRRELGSDINAACGQLRRSVMDKEHGGTFSG